MDFDRAVTVHRPRALWRVLGVAPLFGTAVAIVLWASGHSLGEANIPLLVDPLIFSAVFSVWVRRRNPRPRKVKARLEAGAEGVRIDGVEVLARGSVRRGYVQPWTVRPPTVRLVG